MTSRTLRLVAALATVTILAAACGSEAPTAAGGPSATELLDFTAPQVGGGELSAASLAGTDTVMWFWAPWCTTCRAEAPDVAEVAEAFGGSVTVIGVAGRGEESEMEQFVADTGTGGIDHIVDGDGSIWSEFGVAAQPAFAFINDDGEVEVVAGSMGLDGLTAKLEALQAA